MFYIESKNVTVVEFSDIKTPKALAIELLFNTLEINEQSDKATQLIKHSTLNINDFNVDPIQNQIIFIMNYQIVKLLKIPAVYLNNFDTAIKDLAELHELIDSQAKINILKAQDNNSTFTELSKLLHDE